MSYGLLLQWNRFINCVRFRANEKMLLNGAIVTKAIDLGLFWSDIPKRTETDRKKVAVNVADWKIILTQCPLEYVTHSNLSSLANKQYIDTTVLPPQKFARKPHYITMTLDCWNIQKWDKLIQQDTHGTTTSIITITTTITTTAITITVTTIIIITTITTTIITTFTITPS